MNKYLTEAPVVCPNCCHTNWIDNHNIHSSGLYFDCWNKPFINITIKCPICGEFHEVRVPILFGEPEVL